MPANAPTGRYYREPRSPAPFASKLAPTKNRAASAGL